MRRKLIQINAPENLYNKIEFIRKKFKEQNGIDITLIQATDILTKSIKKINIPNLLKYEKQKSRRY